LLLGKIGYVRYINSWNLSQQLLSNTNLAIIKDFNLFLSYVFAFMDVWKEKSKTVSAIISNSKITI